MALGAAGTSLIRMLVAQSMKPVAWGLGVGLVASLGLARYLDSLLFNVTATDVSVYVAVAMLLALAALVASFVPTLKAMRNDPVQTLKAE